MIVFITSRFPDDIVKRISETYHVDGHLSDSPLDHRQLSISASRCEGLICTITDTIDADIIDASKHLKIVANYGVGYNNIDVAAATRRGIMVTNTPGVLTNTTADLAMALILAVGRRVVEGDRRVRNGEFHHWSPFEFLGADITGKTLGLIGMGRIGQAVVQRARGFSMSVLYHNRHRLSVDQEQALGVTYAPLDQLLAGSDFVSLHVPLTPDTRHLIGARQLALMKPGAYLINTARGPVIDEKALVAVLEQGKIAGAGLDVYENEPELTPGLKALSNVVLLPHVGSATSETRYRMAVMAAENLLTGLAGQRPPNCVNPQVLTTD